MSTQHPNNPRPIRAIPARAQNSSFSNYNCEEANVIRYALRDISPSALHAQLAHSIQNLHIDQIHHLLDALETAGIVTKKHKAAVKDKQQRHCVRCHHSYLERENNPLACVIAHSKAEVHGTTVPVSDASHRATKVHIKTNNPAILGEAGNRAQTDTVEGQPAMVTKTAAMDVYILNRCCDTKIRPGERAGYCHQGRHTTTPDNVDYNDANIWSCKTVGCFRPPPQTVTSSTAGAGTPAGTQA